MPGEMCLPVRLMTRAPSGAARPGPTALILPRSTSTSAFSQSALRTARPNGGVAEDDNRRLIGRAFAAEFPERKVHGRDGSFGLILGFGVFIILVCGLVLGFVAGSSVGRCHRLRIALSWFVPLWFFVSFFRRLLLFVFRFLIVVTLGIGGLLGGPLRGARCPLTVRPADRPKPGEVGLRRSFCRGRGRLGDRRTQLQHSAGGEQFAFERRRELHVDERGIHERRRLISVLELAG